MQPTSHSPAPLTTLPQYLVPMSVGVPAQRLAAVLDTGTATFYTSNVNASTANATSQDKPAVLGYSSGQVRVPSFYTAATRISFNDSFLAVIKYEGAALLKYAPVGPHRASGVLGLAWSGWNKYGRSLGNGVRTGALCGSKFNQPCNNTGLLEAMMAVGAIPAGKAKFSIWLNKRWNRGEYIGPASLPALLILPCCSPGGTSQMRVYSAAV